MKLSSSLKLSSLFTAVIGLCALTPLSASAQNFATSVTDFSHLSSNPSFSDPAAALGQPTTLDDDTFGDLYHASMVQPAFGVDQTTGKNLLVGFDTTGLGQVTVQMAAPITHSGTTWFNQDFIVFSNQGFIGSDASGFAYEGTDMSTYQIADGSTFGTLPQVSVSEDGVTFYAVNPASSVLFPENPYHWDGLTSAPDTAGWGALNDFSKPVDPALSAADFANQTVAYADNTLYNGSAGGTSYNFADQTPLTTIDFIRFSAVPAGSHGVIDGVAAVGSALPGSAAPEPSQAFVFLLMALGIGCLIWRTRRRASVGKPT